MHQNEESPEVQGYNIKFIKFKNGEDIVAYVKQSAEENNILVLKPILIVIENEFVTGRQLVNVREWLPPVVTLSDNVAATISKDNILLITDVRDTFKPEYLDIVEYLYSIKPLKKKAARKSIGLDKDEPEKSDKIVPFIVKGSDNGKPN